MIVLRRPLAPTHTLQAAYAVASTAIAAADRTDLQTSVAIRHAKCSVSYHRARHIPAPFLTRGAGSGELMGELVVWQAAASVRWTINHRPSLATDATSLIAGRRRAPPHSVGASHMRARSTTRSHSHACRLAPPVASSCNPCNLAPTACVRHHSQLPSRAAVQLPAHTRAAADSHTNSWTAGVPYTFGGRERVDHRCGEVYMAGPRLVQLMLTSATVGGGS